ncbi:MAG TPA: lysophospholipid acyltransferase family protein [Alphaproteobacteria bacterium]|jgi:KDO2-lipid IV(A) lauroyltransferase|nr:lysophospholipid acyltransferase family protein [Alphaproteobacteria bacterium]
MAEPARPPLSIGEILQGNGLLFVNWLLGLLPIDWCSAIGYRLGVTVGPRSRVRDARLRHNLKVLRPDLAAPDVIEATVRRYWGNSGRAMTEFSVLQRLWKSDRATVSGMENLLAARATGRPRIALFVHLGNWELVGPKILDLGENSSQIVQRLANPYRDRIAMRTRSPFEGRLIEAGPSAGRQILRALVKNGLISMAGDEYLHGTLLAPSFGGPIRLDGNLGRAVRLAKMANAIVCPYYCIRTGGAHFDIRFTPAIELDLVADDYLQRGVETLDAAITPIIVAHLDQWLMLDNFRVPDGAALKVSGSLPSPNSVAHRREESAPI